MIKKQIQSTNRKPRISVNTAWLIASTIIPLFIAFFTIPLIVNLLGIERFGALVLIWSIIGYFGILDFGFGKAITKIVSGKIALGQTADAKMTFLPAIISLGIFGCILAASLAAISSWLTNEILQIPFSIQEEVRKALQITSICIPTAICANVARGYLEGFQLFRSSSSVRMISGVTNYVSAVAVLHYWNRLEAVVMSITVARTMECLLLFLLCLKRTEVHWRFDKAAFKIIKPLFSFGSWISVSNIIGPLMVYADRFIIGVLVSISAVAYYTTVYEVATKLWIFPAALGSALFPLFSGKLLANREEAVINFIKAERYLFVIISIPAFVLIILSSPLLTWWLGTDFSNNSAPTLQLLTIGVLINSIAQIPYTFIQAFGRPDITAKLHIIELPFYIILLYSLTYKFGITGAAIAWTSRVAIDAILLLIITTHILPETKNFLKKIFVILLIFLIFCCLFAPLSFTAMYSIFLMIGVGIIVIFSWICILEKNDRISIIGWFNHFNKIWRNL